MSSTSPSKKENTSDGDKAKRLLAQTFAKLKQMSTFYLEEDLSMISEATIKDDRKFLEALNGTFTKIKSGLPANAIVTRYSTRLVALADEIIPALYVAQTYASRGQRNLQYYEHMQHTRKGWRDMELILEDLLRSKNK